MDYINNNLNQDAECEELLAELVAESQSEYTIPGSAFDRQ